jgi:hypothetical protein
MARYSHREATRRLAQILADAGLVDGELSDVVRIELTVSTDEFPRLVVHRMPRDEQIEGAFKALVTETFELNPPVGQPEHEKGD